MELNDKQLEARNKVDGPLLIIAWAGSWKTATLASRTEYMINEKGIIPSEILMVTFTNKAAWEMRDRVAKILNMPTPKNIYNNFSFPVIGTFHSIWIYLLKDSLKHYSSEELKLWLKKDFVIYDEQDKIAIIKNIIKNKMNLDEKEFPAKQVAFYISDAKNNLVTPEGYEPQVHNNFTEVVFKVYTEYESSLSKNNAIDFDDILIKTYKLLLIPKILEHYQERFKYIMVDEYQDTNLVQYNIVKLLASRYKNLAVVWDDAQSIYSWRWADMRNIINFQKDYPDALIVKLEQNYRSTQRIIWWANKVIANNNMWIKKNLWTENGEWELIQLIEAPDEKLEAKIIANIILKNEEKGREYKDHLILYRTNAQSRRIEESLIMDNIPYRIFWGLKFYDRAEIKDLLAYLKVIFNPSDTVSMKRIINKPTRKIWDKSISILDNYREDFWLTFIQIFENIDEVEELWPWAKKAIAEFYRLYEQLLYKSSQLVVADLLQEIIKTTWYIEYLTDWLPEEEKLSKIDNVNELINLATEYNWMAPRDSLELFLEDISLLTDMDIKDERTDYVTLMTAHSSKWLEEKIVFIAWLEEWLFPNIKSMWTNAFLEEERRLMYVAMTRAKEELYISRAIERFHFWEFARNPESRFIGEIPAEYIEKYDLWPYAKKEGEIFSSMKKFNFNDTSEKAFKPKIVSANNDITQFSLGDKVEHQKFWEWRIMELKWEIADIAFPKVWNKKMNIRIAPVKKV